MTHLIWALLSQLGYDQAQGGEGAVDAGALTQPLPDRTGPHRPLRAGQVDQAHPGHLLTRHAAHRVLKCVHKNQYIYINKFE